MRLYYPSIMFMALLILASGVSLIAGCGQKGALYHSPEVNQMTDKDKAKQTKPQSQPNQQP